MHRSPVNSSGVASVGYDGKDFVLEIEFHNGHVYQYLDVPEAVHRLLLQASSVGAFVNEEIKPRFEWRWA